jgi:hypothetical protein
MCELGNPLVLPAAMHCGHGHEYVMAVHSLGRAQLWGSTNTLPDARDAGVPSLRHSRQQRHCTSTQHAHAHEAASVVWVGGLGRRGVCDKAMLVVSACRLAMWEAVCCGVDMIEWINTFVGGWVCS